MMKNLIFALTISIGLLGLDAASTKESNQLRVGLSKLNNELRNDNNEMDQCTRFVHFLAKHYDTEFDYAHPSTEVAHTLIRTALSEVKSSVGDVGGYVAHLESCLQVPQLSPLEPFPEHVFKPQSCATERQQVASLTSELNGTSEKLNDCQSDVAQLNENLKNWKNQTESLSAQLDALKAEHEALDENRRHIESYVDRILTAFHETNHAIAEAQEKALAAAKDEDRAINEVESTIQNQARQLDEALQSKPTPLVSS